MSEERLLPCPFCGGNPKPDHCDGEDYVWCNACDFYTEHHIWNRRSLPAQHVAVPVEPTEDMLDCLLKTPNVCSRDDMRERYKAMLAAAQEPLDLVRKTAQDS